MKLSSKGMVSSIMVTVWELSLHRTMSGLSLVTAIFEA